MVKCNEICLPFFVLTNIYLQFSSIMIHTMIRYITRTHTIYLNHTDGVYRGCLSPSNITSFCSSRFLREYSKQPRWYIYIYIVSHGRRDLEGNRNAWQIYYLYRCATTRPVPEELLYAPHLGSFHGNHGSVVVVTVKGP